MNFSGKGSYCLEAKMYLPKCNDIVADQQTVKCSGSFYTAHRIRIIISELNVKPATHCAAMDQCYLATLGCTIFRTF